jgi:SAM-dependent methyltransferase
MSAFPVRLEPHAVDEPLAASAALARTLAAAHCDADGHGTSCRAYHGYWQHLRLMGLGKTLSGMPERYLAALAAFLDEWKRSGRDEAPRLLISGCADYSAAAHALHACRAASIAARITALDRCPTPLLLNRWYADRCGATIETVHADILEHRDDVGYDLILTSSLLGYFDPVTRPRLFGSFAALLRPRGVELFANRLRPEPEGHPVGFDAEQAARFAARAAELAARLPPQAALTADEARAAAQAYAQSFASYPVNSAAGLRALAIEAGLEWMAGEVAPTSAPPAGVSGPTLSDGATYVFVQLRKP